MNLEDIMLKEISQHKKRNTVTSHLYKLLSIVKIIATESRMLVTRN